MAADTPAESEVNKNDKSVGNAKMSERDIVIKLESNPAGNNIEFAEKISLNNDSEVKDTSVIIEQAEPESVDDELGDEDHDDVPGDFFDDFLKEDFMAGLDVVDEDEGEEKNEDEEVHLQTSKKNKITIEEEQKRKQVHVESNDLRQLLIKEKEKRSSNDLRNVLKGKLSRKLKKSKPKPINADEFDIRRDPKKTKRDIERDKVRCEKDKEKKIISEKLKLVETGLVPPGMEMETDLDDIKNQKDIIKTDKLEQTKTSKPRGSKTNSTSSRRRSNSRSPRKRSPLRRSPLRTSITLNFRRKSPKRSPLRRSSPRRSPRRVSNNLSPKRSPPRRRSRERSPRRSRDRSPRRSRDRSPRRSRDRSPRRSRERSPRRPVNISPRRSRERSPRRTREESPRRSRDRSNKRIDTSLRRSLERADRDRNRRSRSHDKFHEKYSPRHKRSRSRSPRRRRDTEKKKSFLQEIADKLNETRPVNIPYQHMMHPFPSDIYRVGGHSQNLLQNPIPAPVPVPVPPPNVNQFQSQQQYDQSFFIGTSPTLNSPNVPINMPTQTGPQTPLRLTAPPSIMQNTVPSNNDVSKLFQDKKITLTEFLSITAKPEIYSASSAHMKEKIKVISRCQEAIKYLGNSEKKLTGPFVVLKGVSPKSAADKYKSPLIKSSQIKLPFTEVPKGEQHRSEFNLYIDNLLLNLGLFKDDVIVIDDAETVHQETKRPQDAAPPPPNISFGKKSDPKPAEKYKLSKFIQTDAPACVECDKRKKIFYKNVGTQCGNDGIMFSIGTQASDDDFYTRLPTSQSLASLTPAQLLARSGVSKSGRNFDDNDFDLPYPIKKLPVRPAGYAYGADVFGGNQINPPKFSSSSSPGRAFDPPGLGGMRGNRPEANRYNYY